jgi:hypothetical protein
MASVPGLQFRKELAMGQPVSRGPSGSIRARVETVIMDFDRNDRACARATAFVEGAVPSTQSLR